MFDHNRMGEKKRTERRLDEISHLFLSRQRSSRKQRKLRETGGLAKNPGLISLSSERPEKWCGERPFAGKVEQNLCLIFSTCDLFSDRAFLAYELALELSKRDFAVGVIDTCNVIPNTLLPLDHVASRSPFTDFSFSPLENASMSPQISLSPQQGARMSDTKGPQANIRACYLGEPLDLEPSLGIIKGMLKESHFLIMNAPNDIPKLGAAIPILKPFFIIPITNNPEILLRSYVLIKELLVNMHVEEIGILVMDQEANGEAEKGFCLIAEMVHKFHSASVFFMGVIHFEPHSRYSIPGPSGVRQGIGGPALTRSICELADAVVEEFNHR
jgi:hypothetical protein